MIDPCQLIVAPKAALELQKIHYHIAKDSPQNAESMILRIMDALELLRTVPHRAALPTHQVGPKHPVRSVIVHPYIVYFRAIDGERVVRVLRIRHGARRSLKRFG